MLKHCFWVCCVLLMATGTHARTWLVEKDGTGDFTVIQDAVDASADGDTVQIGPGRFDDYSLYEMPAGWTTNTFVSVTEKSIVLIGAGRDITVIGPDSYWYEEDNNPMGIFVLCETSDVEIHDLTVENVADGIYYFPGYVYVEECAIIGCRYGMMLFVERGGGVYECEFFANNTGIFFGHGSNDTEVQDCYFDSNGEGVDVQDSQYVSVRRCAVENSTASAISFVTSTSCLAEECRLTDNRKGVTVFTAQCIVTDAIIIGGDTQISVYGGGSMSGSGNILFGGDVNTIFLFGGYMTMTESQIFHESGYLIYVNGYNASHPPVLDFTNNYWGYTDPDSIADLIWDGNDDPAIPCVIDFEPFMATILDEPMGWGDVKRLFH